MSKHGISWLNIPGYRPETWNPVIGCSKVSEGCENCYAEKMAWRLSNIATTGYYQNVVVKSQLNPLWYRKWSGKAYFAMQQLYAPRHWKKPRAVFVCSMGDLFHESVTFEQIDAVFSIMSEYDQHLYILLTKRPERMLEFWKWKESAHQIPWSPKRNVWLGVSAENQKRFNERVPYLLSIPNVTRFVSLEPLLGPIDFYELIFQSEHYHSLKGFGDISGGDFGKFDGPRLHWVIVGGETGSKARPMNPGWAFHIGVQCVDAQVPFFFKQWGEWLPTSQATNDQIRASKQSTEIGLGIFSHTMLKVGSKVAGDLLAGYQYHQWPALPEPVISRSHSRSHSRSRSKQ